MTNGALDLTNSNMSAPLLAKNFSVAIFAIISAIAFATVLGTVSGLLVASSGAVVHDLVNGAGKHQERCPIKSRSVLVKSPRSPWAGIAIVLGIVFKNMNVSFLVGWAFAVAASANLPAIIMVLFLEKNLGQRRDLVHHRGARIGNDHHPFVAEQPTMTSIIWSASKRQCRLIIRRLSPYR